MKDSLFSKVLELVLEEVPAGRSLVLLSGEAGGLRARLSRGIDWEADHDVCRDIVGRAIESGQPLLIRDFGAHPLFQGHSSVRAKGLASALCLPFLAGENNLIREESLSPKINPRKEAYSEDSKRLTRARSEFEKRFLREALARCGYRRTRTAAEIGITRQGLFKLMKKHEIETP